MLEDRVIQRTLRVPASPGDPGDGTVVARQLDAALLDAALLDAALLDAALLDVEFACSRELLEHVAALRPDAAIDAAVRVLGAVRALVGFLPIRIRHFWPSRSSRPVSVLDVQLISCTIGR